MKLLISTYACAPHHGSEHAVGWNWTTEAHRQGHQVWAMASSVHREAIETVCRNDPKLAGIKWLFPEVKGWRLQPGIEPKWERTYNLLWQAAALRTAERLAKQVHFDVVHHLTWGGIRAPTFLGRLAPPLVIGPIGGGETTPPELRSGLHLRARATEFIRELTSRTITINPIVRDGLGRARLIFVRTPETAGLLTARMRAKAACFTEISLPAEAIGGPRQLSGKAPKILFIGRLIYWKGAHIAIQAMGHLKHCLPEATLTVVGKGPELARLQAEVVRLGLQRQVTFVPWLPRDQVTSIYDAHDIFLFPSLHDSGGTVVLEALSRGLPVICANSGGPRVIVTPQSGIVVPAEGRNTAQFARVMADEIMNLFAGPARYSRLSAGAIARAGAFILRNRVESFYGQIATMTQTYDGAVSCEGSAKNIHLVQALT